MLTEKEKRLHRACFTGHRPEKIHKAKNEILKDLKREILNAVDEGFNVFISGMARGTDIWAAEIILQLRANGKNIRLICACPYKGFAENWIIYWKIKCMTVLKAADYIKYISPEYRKDCFQTRNEWMVNHSAKVIAVFNGEKGGTANTVKYASLKGLQISFIEA